MKDGQIVITPGHTLTAGQKATLRKNAVAKFAVRVGEREIPEGSNRGDLMDRANAYVGNPEGSAYCIASATYCLGMAAVQMGLTLADTTVIRTGYCPAGYAHAKANGTLIDPHDVVSGKEAVLPGDFMLEFEPGQDHGLLPHHCEMVEIPPAKGTPGFTTIGGNTIPDGYTGDDSRGLGVFRKHRSALATNASGHNRFCFVRTV